MSTIDVNSKSILWPAEWEAHQSTWMGFPCREEIWSNGIEAAQKAFANVANLISEYENINMVVHPFHRAKAKQILSSAVNLLDWEIDDSWLRDTAPIFIQRQNQIHALDFKFNAWGEKFSPYDKDANLAQHIASHGDHNRIEVDMVLEGGAIHSNGHGKLLTTKECLLNKNRNPHLNQGEIESILATHLGTKEFIWLEYGISGDVDTDGHIDNIACFVNKDTILTQTCRNTSENHERYAVNKNIIQEHGLNIIEIEEPSPIYENGIRVPLSYINFYIANDLVIVPKFGCKQDDQALQVINSIFPNRQVHSIDANEILVGGGGIHCITMQQPL